MRKCDRKKCDGEGKWMPILEVRVKGYKGAPALIAFDLRVCDYCKLVLLPSDLVDDVGWARIVKEFTSRGNMAPTRKLLKIRWSGKSDPESRKIDPESN